MSSQLTYPEEDAKFDGVDHVFNEDEPSQFPDISGHVWRNDLGIFLGFLRADGQIHLQVLSTKDKKNTIAMTMSGVKALQNDYDNDKKVVAKDN